MERYKTLYQFNSDDHFLNQMKRMNAGLKELAVIIDQAKRPYQDPSLVYRRVAIKQRTPALAFPFSLLAYGIDAALTRCDQAVGRFVNRVIGRWMQRFLSWRRNRKRV